MNSGISGVVAPENRVFSLQNMTIDHFILGPHALGRNIGTSDIRSTVACLMAIHDEGVTPSGFADAWLDRMIKAIDIAIADGKKGKSSKASASLRETRNRMAAASGPSSWHGLSVASGILMNALCAEIDLSRCWNIKGDASLRSDVVSHLLECIESMRHAPSATTMETVAMAMAKKYGVDHRTAALSTAYGFQAMKAMTFPPTAGQVKDLFGVFREMSDRIAQERKSSPETRNYARLHAARMMIGVAREKLTDWASAYKLDEYDEEDESDGSQLKYQGRGEVIGLANEIDRIARFELKTWNGAQVAEVVDLLFLIQSIDCVVVRDTDADAIDSVLMLGPEAFDAEIMALAPSVAFQDIDGNIAFMIDEEIDEIEHDCDDEESWSAAIRSRVWKEMSSEEGGRIVRFACDHDNPAQWIGREDELAIAARSEMSEIIEESIDFGERFTDVVGDVLFDNVGTAPGSTSIN